MLTIGIPPPLPKSVFNRMLVDGLFGVEGQGGEIYTEFSTVAVGGNSARATASY